MKKKNLFLRSLLIYCLVLIIILGAGLFVLNRFLVAYEASRPDNVAEEFVSGKDRSFWLDGLQELIDEGFNEFTLPGTAISDFGIDEQGEIRWRSGPGDDSSQKYDVRLGSSKICTITLTPDESVGFGMHSWAVSGCEFNMPGGTEINLSVPSGCTASINGVEVGSEYIVDVGSITAPLEHDFDIPPTAEIYKISGMMGPAELKAYSPSGVELRAETVSSNHVEFLPEPGCSFSFCALSGSEVYVNGVEISGELCSAVDVGLDTGDSILRYECSGLYAEPEIEVIHDGESVSPLTMPIGECYIPGAGAEIEGEMAKQIEGFISAYIDFSSNKNRAAQANFYALAQYLVPNSEFYTLTAATIDNIVWASTENIQVNGMDYYNLIPLGDDRYICSIYYDMSYILGSSPLHIQNGNTILIEMYDGKYRISAMSAALD